MRPPPPHTPPVTGGLVPPPASAFSSLCCVCLYPLDTLLDIPFSPSDFLRHKRARMAHVHRLDRGTAVRHADARGRACLVPGARQATPGTRRPEGKAAASSRGCCSRRTPLAAVATWGFPWGLQDSQETSGAGRLLLHRGGRGASVPSARFLSLGRGLLSLRLPGAPRKFPRFTTALDESLFFPLSSPKFGGLASCYSK